MTAANSVELSQLHPTQREKRFLRDVIAGLDAQKGPARKFQWPGDCTTSQEQGRDRSLFADKSI